MKRTLKKAYGIGGLGLWLFGAFAVTLASADSPAKGFASAQSNPISDVRLNADRTLSGRAVDTTGEPLVGQSVTLSSDTSESKTATTDSEGAFVFRDVSGGTFTLNSGDHLQYIRAWTHESAPPAAQTAARLVCGPTVRGQFGNTIGGLTMPSIHPARYLNHPLAVGGVIGCAIAAPLAIHNPVPDVPATLVYSPSLSYLRQYVQ